MTCLKERTKNLTGKPYLNPKTTEDLKEVFREGNHTPPEPLIEVAKNPTDENIKNWFELVKKKNQFIARLHKKMSDYLKKTNNRENLIHKCNIKKTNDTLKKSRSC